MTICAQLDTQAQQRPNALALIDERAGQRLTFAELAHASRAAAAWWQAQGIRRGSGVLIFVPMSAALYVALLGLFRLGATALFMDPGSSRAQLAQCCARRPPAAFLGTPGAQLLRWLTPGLRRIPRSIVVGGCWPWATRWPRTWGNLHTSHGTDTGATTCTPPPLTTDQAQPADPALITFTSGSTGVPKAAVRTHAFLLAQYEALAPNLALVAGEVDLATLPVFVLANLAAGVTTVLPAVDLRRPGAIDAARLCLQIERETVNRLTASPALLAQLTAEGRRTGRTLPGLRKIYTGGAPVFPRLLHELRALAPHAHSFAVYGSTEAEPIAHLGADELTPSLLALSSQGGGLPAGKTVDQIHLRIVHDQWGQPRPDLTTAQLAANTLAPGRSGEIIVSGAHVLPGYLDGVGDAETKFKVEGRVWHRTGDAGLLDAEGRLWLLGRCAAKIVDDSGVIYPLASETVAMTFPEVRLAALVAWHGQRLLLVELQPTSTASSARPAAPDLATCLLKACAATSVTAVEIWPRLPVDRRHNAKIDYPALLAQLAKRPRPRSA